MKENVNLIFHIVALIHHVYVLRYSVSGLDFAKSTDPRVAEMEHFAYRYFTTWNLLLQIVYLCLVLFFYAFRFCGVKEVAVKVSSLKGYWFTTFIFPFSVMVSLMFWGLYNINRDFVLPEACDEIFPKWLNHSVHTNILLLPIVEMVTTKQRLPSFKSAFYGISILLVVYDSLFFYTYFEQKRWIYGVFYVLNWYERIVLIISNYVASLVVMRIGLFLQSTLYSRKNYCDNKLE